MSLGVFWPLLTSASTVFYDLIFTVLTLLHYQMPAFDEPLPLEDSEKEIITDNFTDKHKNVESIINVNA